MDIGFGTKILIVHQFQKMLISLGQIEVLKLHCFLSKHLNKQRANQNHI